MCTYVLYVCIFPCRSDCSKPEQLVVTFAAGYIGMYMLKFHSTVELIVFIRLAHTCTYIHTYMSYLNVSPTKYMYNHFFCKELVTNLEKWLALNNRSISIYIKIQPKTIDLSTRLWGITTEFVGFIPPEPRAKVYCLTLNFNISKLVYLAKVINLLCLHENCSINVVQ